MPEVCNVRATPISLPSGRQTWTVVDDDGASIEVVDVFLGYLHGNANSPYTIESYARHLAFLFRWLAIRNVPWGDLTIQALSAFTSDLQDGSLRSLARVGTYRPQKPRSRGTCEAVIAAVYSFLDYWMLEDGSQGPKDLRLRRDAGQGTHSKHAFLAHVESKLPTAQRRIRVRGPKAHLPKIINFEDDFTALLEASNTDRDRALLSAMYDGGLRIGQALGLRYDDLDFARKRITITRRVDNANGAISKQRADFSIGMPNRFFALTDRAMSEQASLDIDSEWLFVNLTRAHRGGPMSANNAWDIVKRIGVRCDVTLHPHTLRHTHGTALAKDGWTQPMIAKRLGQSNPSSADCYIHLAAEDVQAKYLESDLAKAEL